MHQSLPLKTVDMQLTRLEGRWFPDDIFRKKTHSLRVDYINYSANLALVLSIVDKNNASNFDKSSESLKSWWDKKSMKNYQFFCGQKFRWHWRYTNMSSPRRTIFNCLCCHLNANGRWVSVGKGIKVIGGMIVVINVGSDFPPSYLFCCWNLLQTDREMYGHWSPLYEYQITKNAENRGKCQKRTKWYQHFGEFDRNLSATSYHRVVCGVMGTFYHQQSQSKW